MPAPKKPSTAAATAAVTRRGDDTAATRLRAHKWHVTPPEQTHLDWHAIAETLAQRLRHHAYCNQHPPQALQESCPFCEDRAAYSLYLAATQNT